MECYLLICLAADSLGQSAGSIRVKNNCEVAFYNPIKVLFADFHWQIVVDAIVADLTQQVARMAAAQTSFGFDLVLLDEVIDDLIVVSAFDLFAINLE